MNKGGYMILYSWHNLILCIYSIVYQLFITILGNIYSGIVNKREK